MNYRTIAQHVYYRGSLPLRVFHRYRSARRGTAPLGVLFYHRIADTEPNAWTMSNKEFQRQMIWLKNHVDVVSLSELQSRLAIGRNDRMAIAVTFDDGYAENCDQAIPFLVEHCIPATYFVSLDYVKLGKPFPHDAAAGKPLPPNTPHQIRGISAAGIEIGAHTRTHCDVGALTDFDVMEDELLSATDELAEMADQSIRYFAFPYGLPQNLSRAAAELLKEYGLAGVCSAFGAYNLPGQDPFHLRRFHADPEFVRFLNWVTIDPRKQSLYRDFEIPESEIRSSKSQRQIEFTASAN
ncbi:MAG: polysaccharide deacetylase family protein [Planctomycetota bacterium]